MYMYIYILFHGWWWDLTSLCPSSPGSNEVVTLHVAAGGAVEFTDRCKMPAGTGQRSRRRGSLCHSKNTTLRSTHFFYHWGAPMLVSACNFPCNHIELPFIMQLLHGGA